MVLFRGPCDITAVSKYIKKKNVVIESSIKGVFLNKVWDCSISTYLAQSAENRMIQSHFVDPTYYPSQTVYEGKYEAIVLSVIGEGILGIYENAKDKSRIAYGIWTFDATQNDGSVYFDPSIQHGGIPGITKEEYNRFSKEYRYLGRIQVEESVENYELFVKRIPPECKIIFFLGPTLKADHRGEINPAMENAVEFYDSLNRTLVEKLAVYSNVAFVCPDDYLFATKHPKALFYYNAPSLLHYPCKTYYKMGKRVEKLTKGRVKVARSSLLLQMMKRIVKIRKK